MSTAAPRAASGVNSLRQTRVRECPSSEVVIDGVGTMVAVSAGNTGSVATMAGVAIGVAGEPHEMISVEITRGRNERTIFTDLDLMQNSSSLSRFITFPSPHETGSR